MTYKEETYVLDTLKEIQETIRSPEFKQLIKETHENNIMLRQIIKVIITEIMKDDQGENFNRSLAVCFPEVTVSRKIDATGDNVLWTFKINYKTL